MGQKGPFYVFQALADVHFLIRLHILWNRAVIPDWRIDILSIFRPEPLTTGCS